MTRLPNRTEINRRPINEEDKGFSNAVRELELARERAEAWLVLALNAKLREIHARSFARHRLRFTLDDDGEPTILVGEREIHPWLQLGDFPMLFRFADLLGVLGWYMEVSGDHQVRAQPVTMEPLR